MPGILDNPSLAIYIAAGVVLVVLAGLFWYLWTIERSVAELRRKINERPAAPPEAVPLRPQRRVVQEQRDGVNRG